jgi:alpha-galactosidase
MLHQKSGVAMKKHLKRKLFCGLLATLAPWTLQSAAQSLAVSIDEHGSYALPLPGASAPVLTAGVAAEVNGRWIHSADYPRHAVEKRSAEGYLGAADEWQVVFSGLQGKPDLLYRLRAYRAEPFVDMQVTVRNTTDQAVDVEAIRAVDATGDSVAALNGPAEKVRVLSDSFSEDRPAMQIHDLADAEHDMHRAVGSQLIYNRESQQSLFIGALTSEKFLTILRLHTAGTGSGKRIASYEVDSAGTTEMEKENSLEKSSAEDRVELSLPMAPGAELSSETVVMSAGNDYHRQLETYGSLIRKIHDARVTAPPLMGWWSWTAYYFGLNEGAALTNAMWEAEHLRQFGYDIFHIDEGYQYARGEYTTPDARVFPNGLGPLEYQVRGLGLTPGIWTAPFEVSERSWVFQQHPDWLVKNAQGQPIHAGFVDEGKDRLYILDTTNPVAQDYLRETYTRLVHDWGIHYIKMDFMDDSAIEGYYSKPHTTAMEAQRIGLGIIRKAVGQQVYLDKDGSAMLNPVGYVDYGRISQDTGHSFGASRDAATGIAARYYMNRNFFVADPDAFTVSTQRISDQSWHEGKQPLTIEEAKASIALAAVSGGMLEIGDNLPTLQNSPDRLALIENRDLIDMVRLGKASVPVDLMSYAEEDHQPSIFYLRESRRQTILTVFNWTEQPRSRTIRLADFGFGSASKIRIVDVFDGMAVEASAGSFRIEQPAHSVQMLKIVDDNAAAPTPAVYTHCAANGRAGESLPFSALPAGGEPVVLVRWDFGDGVQTEGARVQHAWTQPGDYLVSVTAEGLDDMQSEQKCSVAVKGYLPSVFAPELNQRYQPQPK